MLFMPNLAKAAGSDYLLRRCVGVWGVRGWVGHTGGWLWRAGGGVGFVFGCVLACGKTVVLPSQLRLR